MAHTFECKYFHISSKSKVADQGWLAHLSTAAGCSCSCLADLSTAAGCSCSWLADLSTAVGCSYSCLAHLSTAAGCSCSCLAQLSTAAGCSCSCLAHLSTAAGCSCSCHMLLSLSLARLCRITPWLKPCNMEGYKSVWRMSFIQRNEYLNIFVASKSNDYFCKGINLSKNILIFEYFQCENFKNLNNEFKNIFMALNSNKYF